MRGDGRGRLSAGKRGGLGLAISKPRGNKPIGTLEELEALPRGSCWVWFKKATVYGEDVLALGMVFLQRQRAGTPVGGGGNIPEPV